MRTSGSTGIARRISTRSSRRAGRRRPGARGTPSGPGTLRGGGMRSPARARSRHAGVHARIGLSRIQGVGVRAIRDIPAGTAVFRGETERVVWVRRAAVRRLPSALRQLYVDFGMVWDGRYGVPRTLNMLSVGWYLNHSDRPNVAADEWGRFHALRRIRKGEELTADYRTFADERLPFRPKRSRRGRV